MAGESGHYCNMDYLQKLNESQRAAVEYGVGALLILAGAGTGKTTTLTTRIAHLINTNQVSVHNILAVTFTNKAAREMRTRIVEYLQATNPDDGQYLWAGTFHSLAARMVRKHADILGFQANYTIIDEDDSQRLIKNIMKDKGFKDDELKPSLVGYHISKAKDEGLTPREFVPSMPMGRVIHTIYELYQQELKNANSMDFGDLLLNSVILLEQYPDVLQFWRNKFKYILVDEFQDTNRIQYRWLKLLVGDSHNICAVGDDDQSIYGWRGAEIANILNFPRDFANCKIIKLEENYRSTPNILKSAAALISKNNNRHAKTLYTQNKNGDGVRIWAFDDMNNEARAIAAQINKALIQGYAPRDIAILVRASYQMRVLEGECNFRSIPYKVVGGAKFFNREEVRDAVGFLRLVYNGDNISFLRMANKPARGLGERKMAEITEYADNKRLSYCDALYELCQNNAIKQPKIQEFAETIHKYRQNYDEIPPPKLLDDLCVELGYYDYLHKMTDRIQAQTKRENINELLNYLTKYTSLAQFCDEIALMTDNEEEQTEDAVAISTIHAAKGLEFKMVFLPGWEQGVFPTNRALDEPGGLEEERRLGYVAITRAKRHLFISFALNRMIYGGFEQQIPSVFLENLDIPVSEWTFAQEWVRHHIMGTKKNIPMNHNFQGNFTQNTQNYNPTGRAMPATSARAPMNNPPQPRHQFIIGQEVNHPRFGRGFIQSLSDDTALVSFNGDEKNILCDFLERV